MGMTWPIEPTQIARFAYGLEEVFVIEEKRDLIEGQIKSILFNMNPEKRPRVFGKLGRDGKPFIRSILDLDAGQVALALAEDHRRGQVDAAHPRAGHRGSSRSIASRRA